MLTPTLSQHRSALRYFCEVEALNVEARAAFQVANIIVNPLQAEDPERFELCHAFKIPLFAAPARPTRGPVVGLGAQPRSQAMRGNVPRWQAVSVVRQAAG